MTMAEKIFNDHDNLINCQFFSEYIIAHFSD